MNTKEINENIAKLAQKLRINGPLTSLELMAVAKVSQPQLSRYLKLMGEQVLKVGRGKRTQYLHTREIPQIGIKTTIFRVTQKGNL